MKIIKMLPMTYGTGTCICIMVCYVSAWYEKNIPGTKEQHKIVYLLTYHEITKYAFS